MEKEMHPHLIKALKTVISYATKEEEEKYFKIGLKKLIESHLAWMEDWIETNQRIFFKLDKVVADSHEDDMAMCLFAIDEWENEDRQIGMRYNKLSQKFKKLMPVEKKQMLEKELAIHREKMEELVEKANILAQNWLKKLEKHTYNPNVAPALKWLSTVTAEDLISNYERWEKEKL